MTFQLEISSEHKHFLDTSLKCEKVKVMEVTGALIIVLLSILTILYAYFKSSFDYWKSRGILKNHFHLTIPRLYIRFKQYSSLKVFLMIRPLFHTVMPKDLVKRCTVRCSPKNITTYLRKLVPNSVAFTYFLVQWQY